MSLPPAASAAVPRRVALVAGGGSGLGAAVVQAFARRGWAVAIHAHASFAAARAAAETLVVAGVPALAVTADLREEGPARVVVRRVADHFGRLDALVSCVAVRREMPLAELAADDLRFCLDVGLVGTVVLAQEAGAVMARQETGGTILLVTDADAADPRPGNLAGVLVAGAIPVAASGLAAEFAGSRVRVQAFGPTAVPATEEAAGIVALVESLAAPPAGGGSGPVPVVTPPRSPPVAGES
jgi:NAD(P)-dependent dehydrogenase (short-subunit alcohol dehydrogenase family)